MKMKSVIDLTYYLKGFKKLGKSIKFKKPDGKDTYKLTLVAFLDANRLNDRIQIGFISGLQFGEFKPGSTFHTICWMSRKSSRPVRSIGTAETIAARFAIDEGKFSAKSYEEPLDVKTDLGIAVDSIDLWGTLTTCHETNDKSVSADVKVIRFEIETRNDNWMTWLPGKNKSC